MGVAKGQEEGPVLRAMGGVLVSYELGGMRVSNMYVDPEFAPMRNELLGVGTTLNVASANGHVAVVQQEARVLKKSRLEQGGASSLTAKFKY